MKANETEPVKVSFGVLEALLKDNDMEIDKKLFWTVLAASQVSRTQPEFHAVGSLENRLLSLIYDFQLNKGGFVNREHKLQVTY